MLFRSIFIFLFPQRFCLLIRFLPTGSNNLTIPLPHILDTLLTRSRSLQMSPRVIIVFLPFHDSGFETPSTAGTDKFESVRVDAGFETPFGDESLAINVRLDGVSFVGTEGVAFLSDETVVVSHVGFVDASKDYSGSDVTAYEPSSVATGGFGGTISK